MRVLVCGGRDYRDMLTVWNALDHEHEQRPIHEIIHGDAGKEDEDGNVICGADKWAAAWARQWAIDQCPYPILEHHWQEFGKIMGPIRNQFMLDLEQPDLVIAFPGGRGTADMVRRARKAGVEVREISE